MSDSSKPTVAICGLGTMGAGMARQLLSAGYSTSVYNRSRERAVSLESAGATVVDSPRAAAQKADIVISMVSDDNASRAVWLGENGALSGVKRGALLIESSTLTVEWVKELAHAAQQRQCDFVDAPVTGSKPQAEAGELLFLAGGTENAVQRARPLFDAMGRGVVHVGETGSGALLKLINNFLCGVQAASMAEALGWLQAANLNPAEAIKVLGEGAPGSPILRRTAERATQHDFTPAFSLRLMIKDLMYAVQEASRSGLELHTAMAALERFRQAEQKHLGEEDFAAVVQPLLTEAATGKRGKP
jgi:3-hydroxyisobutyrate dehydrogenase